MGLTRQSKRKGRATKPAASPTDELDALIKYGHAALTAPGAAPLALQLDTALRLAGLHLRRAAKMEDSEENIRWAVTLASFVVDRCVDTTPAAVVELTPRAIAVLDVCAPELTEDETDQVQAAIERARTRLERAEQLCALSLEDAITSLVIGEALLEHSGVLAPTMRAMVNGRAHGMLISSTVAARRAGHAGLADAAIAKQLAAADATQKASAPTAPSSAASTSAETGRKARRGRFRK